MTRPTVVFDVDGVLADFCYGFSERAVRVHDQPGPPHSNGAQRTWDWAEHPGYPSEVIDAIWRYIANDATGFWRGLRPLISSGEATEMRAMFDGNRDLDLVYMTARPGDTAWSQTRSWLIDHDLPLGEITIASDKVEACDRLEGGDAQIVGVIDDKPETVRDLRQAGLPVAVRDWQYNRGRVGETAHRVGSVSEFLGWVRDRLASAEA